MYQSKEGKSESYCCAKGIMREEKGVSHLPFIDKDLHDIV